MEPTTPEALDPPANVLFVHAARCEPDGCERLCRVDGDVAELRVSFSNGRPEAPTGENAPSKLGIISVGDVLRAAKADAGPDFSGPIAVDAVDDPTDLSAIGVSVSRFCEHWSAGDERIVLCFQSLDALLRHTSPKKVFQFTHVLTNRLASVGAFAHFHFDPSAHDDRIVSTFGSIFDEVVADDSARASLPEASDEDVARLVDEWEDGTDGRRSVAVNGPTTEATDEEIARLLGE